MKNLIGRLLIKNKGDLEIIKKWYELLRKDFIPIIHSLGCEPESDLERSGLLILIGFVSQDSRVIARVTGWDQRWVQQKRKLAKNSGIWCGNGKIKAEWLSNKTDDAENADTLTMLVDIMIVNGDIERSRNGLLRLSNTGLEKAATLLKTLDNTHTSKSETTRFKDGGNPNGE